MRSETSIDLNKEILEILQTNQTDNLKTECIVDLFVKYREIEKRNSFNKYTIEYMRDLPLHEKLRAIALLMHAGAAWGFSSEGFWLEQAADIIQNKENDYAKDV